MDNLRMLFHELGHLHHSLLIKTRFASLSSVDRDFVEVPSIMLEQFLWLKDPIRHLSRHYSYISPQMRDAWLDANGNSDEVPPEKLSEEEAAVLAVRDTRSNVRSELTQLFFASYDVLIHAPESHEALEQMNLSEEFNKLQTSIRGLHGGEACGDGWEWSHGESVFRAISGSYSGGYYAYIMWVVDS
jgi:metallopeptidase MepB